MAKNKDAARAEQELAARPPGRKLPVETDFLSTGLTLLNLACYGRTDRGLCKGHVYRLSGRSSSGKTWLGHSILAEAANNPAFDGYALVYDDVERGALMDVKRYFGQKLADRISAPRKAKDKSPLYSEKVSDFYTTIRSRLEKGERVVWVEDSLDSLVPDTESRMSDGKAKAHSQELRKLMKPLEATGSILILVSQVRQDMTPPIPGMKMFGPKEDIISGGMAPQFYSTLDIVLRKSKSLKRTYNERKFTVGHLVTCRVTKNRISGVDHNLTFPFYRDYGIDDVGANVEFLLQMGHWKKDRNGSFEAKELAFDGTAGELVKHVERSDKQRVLSGVVARVWRDVQAALSTERKPRYQ